MYINKTISEIIFTLEIFMNKRFNIKKLNNETVTNIDRKIKSEEFKSIIKNKYPDKDLSKAQVYALYLEKSKKDINLYIKGGIYECITNANKPEKGKFHELLKQELEYTEYLMLRRKRDRVLEKTDKFALVDFPFKSNELKEKWLKYRQELRDLPDKTPDPFNIVWPTTPAPFNTQVKD